MSVLKLHYTKLQFIFISWASVFACAGVSWAQVEDYHWPTVNGGQLTLESQPSEFITGLPPTSVEADRLTGVRDEYMEAEGNAVIIRGDQEIRGNYLYYDQVNDEVTAKEDVSVKMPGVFISGDELKYSPSREIGEISAARYILSETGARGEATKLIFQGPLRKTAINATYTSCDVNQEDVYLKTDLLNLYQDKEYGVARNATVWFKGAPILYTPYISFPLTDKRKTGLLTPSYGQSVQNGFEVTVPMYLNIAPNFDSTVALRTMSERGGLLASHSRYLGKSFSGEFTYDYIGDDKKFGKELIQGESRSYYALSHRQRFGSQFSGHLNLQGISDDTYFKDLSSDLAKTSLVHLPREIGVTAGGTDWNGSARMIHYQTLNFAAPPVQLNPQINLGITPSFGYGFESESTLQISNFDKQNQDGAFRTILYPGVRYVYENDYLTLSPKVGLHYTNYDLDTGVTEDRTLPVYSLRASLAFERDVSLGNADLTQTLVPQIFYVHVPFEDQSNLPLFDSGLSSFSLLQVFSENIFSGGDRINDADQLTVGLTSQFLDAESGVERFKITAAQRFHFDEELVVIKSTDAPRTGNRSDILLGGDGRINQSWSANTLLQYSGVLDEIISHDHRIQYKPEQGKVLSVGYRYTRDVNEQFDLSGQWPIKGNWSTAARWNYAKDSGKLIEGLLGLEYKVGCWAFRMVANRFITGQDSANRNLYSTSFFVQLELRDITRIGSDAVGVLKQNVSGFSDN
ncbi:LPS assembly protein LptD [Burkholderiales bacterium]|nr:LPS assembly protein LptD [Burkholderiales bacterium]